MRTRFAPSPTGFMHVGSLRSALYDYLLAKKFGGSFILRIEDTDQTREVEGAVENIIKILSWAGLDYSEGPGKPGICASYIQSERLSIYNKYAQQLIEQGDAYYCFCSTERLDQMRERQRAMSLPPAYDRRCRNLPKEEVDKNLASGHNHVIRMKVPLEGQVIVKDLIRGDIVFDYKVLDDQVLMKSDGFPTYHLAVVVDDHEMEISHVIRGEEWLPSTPKHLLLYKYFGWTAPEFAHFPLLLNPDRSKLSKRQGDVAVEDYRDKGYLPEALINFIALLGWNPGDGDEREIFSLPELVNEFTIERVGKSGAVFDIEKLQWLNGVYIRKNSAQELKKYIEDVLSFNFKENFKNWDDVQIFRLIDLEKERVKNLRELIYSLEVFYYGPRENHEKTGLAKLGYDQESIDKWVTSNTKIICYR
jgi:glutamyl-tRNA synthetase, bacterial family